MSLVSLENSSIFLTANGQVFKFADNEYYPTKNGVSVCYLNVDGIFNSEKLYLSWLQTVQKCLKFGHHFPTFLQYNDRDFKLNNVFLSTKFTKQPR